MDMMRPASMHGHADAELQQSLLCALQLRVHISMTSTSVRRSTILFNALCSPVRERHVDEDYACSDRTEDPGPYTLNLACMPKLKATHASLIV